MNDSFWQQRRTLMVPILLLVMLASAPARSATVSVLAGTLGEGNANIGYPLNPSMFKKGAMRYQQIYSAGIFSSLSGIYEINSIAFRTDGDVGNRFPRTSLDVQISLSTTSRAVDGLDNSFDNNIGADRTTVFAGSLSISSAHALTSSGSRALDVVINFTSPFRYRIGSANLLLEIFNYSGGLTSQLDAISSGADGMSRLLAYDVSSTADKQDSTGLVTQFTMTAVTVPLPPGIYLLLTAAGGLLLMAPRRRVAAARG